MNIIFLDTETTGLESNRLVQLAYKDLALNLTVNELFKPPCKIDFEAMATHHITEKMVESKPLFEGSEVKKELKLRLENSILIAHNAEYDIKVLKNEGIEVKDYICTMKLAQTLLDSENYSMQYLRYFLGIDIEATAHDALGDITVLEKLFEHLRGSCVYSLDKMVTLSKKPVLLKRITFGKYKGKTFEEIKKLEPSYLTWLANNADDENVRHTAITIYRG